MRRTIATCTYCREPLVYGDQVIQVHCGRWYGPSFETPTLNFRTYEYHLTCTQCPRYGDGLKPPYYCPICRAEVEHSEWVIYIVRESQPRWPWLRSERRAVLGVIHSICWEQRRAARLAS